MAMAAEQDGELAVFRAMQAGQRPALEELMSRNSCWLRALIYAHLGDPAGVEDMLQRVWLRVWQRAGSLREPRTWRAWVRRLARNMACDEARARQRDREGLARTAVAARPDAVEAATPDGNLSVEEQRQLVLRAIGGLPAIYREPLVLRNLEGWNYREIGELLGLPVATVETRLVRARRLLRETLDGKV